MENEIIKLALELDEIKDKVRKIGDIYGDNEVLCEFFEKHFTILIKYFDEVKLHSIDVFIDKDKLEDLVFETEKFFVKNNIIKVLENKHKEIYKLMQSTLEIGFNMELVCKVNKNSIIVHVNIKLHRNGRAEMEEIEIFHDSLYRILPSILSIFLVNCVISRVIFRALDEILRIENSNDVKNIILTIKKYLTDEEKKELIYRIKEIDEKIYIDLVSKVM